LAACTARSALKDLSPLHTPTHPSVCLHAYTTTGRIFASNQRGDFTCHTYPVYKPINTKHFAGADAPLTLLPTHDANFDRLPWARTGLAGWSVAMLLGPLFGAALVGAVYSAVAARHAKKQRARVASSQKLAAVEDGLPPIVAAGKDSAPAGN
jgi:hypothetical protein